MRVVRDIVKLHSGMGLSIRKIQGATVVVNSLINGYYKDKHELCNTNNNRDT